MTVYLYLLIYVASLVASIVLARHQKFSIGWAVFFGLLFSPAAGVFYAYMALSGDRKPWRVGLIGFGLALALFLAFIFLGALFTSSTPINTAAENSIGYPATTVASPNPPAVSNTAPTSVEDITANVQITCNVGNMKQLTGVNTGIRFYRSDFDPNGNFIGYDKNGALQTACGVSQEEANAILAKPIGDGGVATLFTVSLVNYNF